MKIPFDIKYKNDIETGKYKLVTREQCGTENIKILDWNAPGKQPIIGYYINDIGNSIPLTWAVDGSFYGTGEHNCRDLFIEVPDPELNEFEKKVKQVMKESQSLVGDEIDIRYIKEVSAKLYEVARKQVHKEIVEHAEEEAKKYPSLFIKKIYKYKHDEED